MLKLKYIDGVLHLRVHGGRGGWVPWACVEPIKGRSSRFHVPARGKRPPLRAVAAAQAARYRGVR